MGVHADCTRKLTRGLLKLWYPRANPIPRLAYLAELWRSGSWMLAVPLLLDILLEAVIQSHKYRELRHSLKRLDEHVKRMQDALGQLQGEFAVSREGTMLYLPGTLVAKGDLIVSEVEPRLACEQVEKPSYWRALETPLHDRLARILAAKKWFPNRFELLYNTWISLLSLVAMLAAPFNRPVAAVLFFCALPLFRNLLFIYSNSRLHLLADLLCKSQTPFDDAAEIDEFDDEALPPTKDIQLTPRMLLADICHRLGGRNESLYWEHDLAFALGTVSFLVYLDKAHLLSLATQIPDQIIYSNGGSTSAIRVVHRSSANLFDITLDDEGEEVAAGTMKGLGLGLAFSTACPLKRTKDTHVVHVPQDQHVAQLCPCAVARALGFRHSVLEEYQLVDQFTFERAPGVHAKLIQAPDSDATQMFALGELHGILELCAYSWNGSTIAPFEFKSKFASIADSIKMHGFSTLAISYRPVIAGGDPKGATRNHIFLGFLMYSTHVRDEVQEFISDLGAGGIRFVLFSDDSELVTKTLGSRLGLEMDWNSCILFSAPPMDRHLAADLSAAFSDPKSRLPRGVNNVRPHLQDVDDIPLRISLFAECDPASVQEMIRIYHENKEIVVAIGLSHHLDNLETFAIADLAISMEPPVKEPLACLGSLVTGMFCPLQVPNEASPYLFTELFREARCLHRATMAALNFFFIGQALVALFGSGWFAYLVVPLLSLSALGGPLESSVMKQIPDPVLSTATMAQSMAKGLFHVLAAALLVRVSGPSDSALMCALVGLSMTHQHLVESVCAFNPLKNRAWLASSVLLLLVSLLHTRSIAGLAASAIAGLLAVAFSEAAKYFWRQQVYLARRRAKLEFNTRLGMHSPR